MMVMPSNNCKAIVHEWAKRWPGSVGHLYSPDGWRGPFPHMPYALDNGAFPCWTNGKEWDEHGFWAMCFKVIDSGKQRPLWVVVPDVVADKAATLRRWDEFAPEIQKTFGFPLAFAAQDGMTPSDVPESADVVFIGGSDEFKWDAIIPFCDAFPRVHVGRVGSLRRLRQCAAAGVESCDSTGWFREPRRQKQLEIFLLEQAGEEVEKQGRLF